MARACKAPVIVPLSAAVLVAVVLEYVYSCAAVHSEVHSCIAAPVAMTRRRTPGENCREDSWRRLLVCWCSTGRQRRRRRWSRLVLPDWRARVMRRVGSLARQRLAAGRRLGSSLWSRTGTLFCFEAGPTRGVPVEVNVEGMLRCKHTSTVGTLSRACSDKLTGSAVESARCVPAPAPHCVRRAVFRALLVFHS